MKTLPQLAASDPPVASVPLSVPPFWRAATHSDLPAALDQARLKLLDVMPVPVLNAVLENGTPAFTCANRGFHDIARRQPLPQLQQVLNDQLISFFASDSASRQFAWSESGVGGRHFLVNLARLAGNEVFEDRCMLVFRDRTAEVETERSLRAEMLRDSLTGLPNRLAFDEAVETVAAEREPSSFAVLVLDLTRFSRVNECVGSIAGDELIITVARRLVCALRSGDLLARLGGDEFAILMTLRDGPGDALHAARRIQGVLASPVRLSDLEIRVDCAIGCAVPGAGGGTAEELVRNAQLALKRAKQSGKVEVYQPGEVAAVRRRFSLETELRRAIEADALTLDYQPLVNLEDRTITGFEALARWTHPDQGPISPADFVPVAEECGLIIPLGRWALDKALRTLAEWDRRAGRTLPCSVSVNVSAVQLVRDTLADVVAQALRDTGVAGARLKLEITESSIIADPERARGVLESWKALDCEVAMDDFGTGYSSLWYLQKLPIDILKIDRSFIMGMLADRDSIAIVRAILSLADALGMRTCAEGIETSELAQTLDALGCSTGQGYYFARPLGAEAAFAHFTATL